MIEKPTLNKYSTPAEVIMHHPKMEEYEETMLNPKYRPVNVAGHWDQIGAQERVVLRRHIREFYPGFSSIVNLTGMGRTELEAAINHLSTESMSS